jgi:hypothetical protein
MASEQGHYPCNHGNILIDQNVCATMPWRPPVFEARNRRDTLTSSKNIAAHRMLRTMIENGRRMGLQPEDAVDKGDLFWLTNEILGE